MVDVNNLAAADALDKCLDISRGQAVAVAFDSNNFFRDQHAIFISTFK